MNEIINQAKAIKEDLINIRKQHHAYIILLRHDIALYYNIKYN